MYWNYTLKLNHTNGQNHIEPLLLSNIFFSLIVLSADWELGIMACLSPISSSMTCLVGYLNALFSPRTNT